MVFGPTNRNVPENANVYDSLVNAYRNVAEMYANCGSRNECSV